MYHFLLSFPVGKVPYLSSDLYEPKYPISCMSFAASSAHVRACQVWQTTKLNLSGIPTGHSLQAVTRARTSYWKTAVLSTGQVFLVCYACCDLKILSDFDLWPVPNFQLLHKADDRGSSGCCLWYPDDTKLWLQTSFSLPSQCWVVPAPPSPLLLDSVLLFSLLWFSSFWLLTSGSLWQGMLVPTSLASHLIQISNRRGTILLKVCKGHSYHSFIKWNF